MVLLAEQQRGGAGAGGRVRARLFWARAICGRSATAEPTITPGSAHDGALGRLAQGASIRVGIVRIDLDREIPMLRILDTKPVS